MQKVRRRPRNGTHSNAPATPTCGRPRAIIPEFRGSKNSHFIATTVDLLSTGVDIPNLDNVVFFRYLESPISFYQMVGRGTRTGEPRGSKAMFRLYDYTNCTRLFGEEFTSRYQPTEPRGRTASGAKLAHRGKIRRRRHDTARQTKIIRVGENQFTVKVEGTGQSILCQEDGKDVLVPYEEYKQRLAPSSSKKRPA